MQTMAQQLDTAVRPPEMNRADLDALAIACSAVAALARSYPAIVDGRAREVELLGPSDGFHGWTASTRILVARTFRP